MNHRTYLHAPHPHSVNSLAELTGDLRRKISARLMREFGVQLPPSLIRRVLDEASELAHETGFPNLFFPALAEEKARVVSASLGRRSYEHSTRTLQNAA